MLALAITTAYAYTEVAGFNGPTWYEHYNSNVQFAGGDGNKNTPYLIENAQQLTKLAYEVNHGDDKGGQYFKIAGNIDLNERINGERLSWVPIGLDDNHPFCGTLTNPDKYKISGMRIDANSTETTKYFGLFGYMKGTVDGVQLTDASEIKLTGSGNYNAGLLCGYLTEGSYVSNCAVEDSYITGTNLDGKVYIGGLVGFAWLIDGRGDEDGKMVSCLAKTTISLTGNGSSTLTAGGVVGNNFGKMVDCHAVVNMTVTDISTSDNSYLGGIVGEVGSGPLRFCSASGDIVAGVGSHAVIGGAFGFVNTVPGFDVTIRLNYTVSTVAVSGGYALGGLIGRCYVRNSLAVNMTSNFSSSYVDARDATYAGGLIGILRYDNTRSTAEQRATWWLAEGNDVNGFCGTMKKPDKSNVETTNDYGVIVGHSVNVPDANFSKMAGYMFYYNGNMCNFKLNGKGLPMPQANNYGGQIPNDDGYGLWGVAFGTGTLDDPSPAALHDGYGDNVEMCFTDNYKLSCLLFYITNDKKTNYCATDVTVDFSIEDINNSSTGEKVCSFSVPDDVTCVRVEDKHLYPLDPGEVVVTIKWNGLQRKVHLDITYGLDWPGGSNSSFDGGDGTAENPWLIHNADQLNASMHDNTNNKYYRLACDIFFNTHLLQEDGTPRSDARPWDPVDFKGHIDGNGKTIYGVYVNKNSLGDGESLGFFKNLYGTVENLAIVDSNVSTDGVSNPNSAAGLLCGTMIEGASVSNCLFHGRVSASSCCSGIAGRVDANNTSITDCFANVHVTYPASSSNPFTASGLCYNTPAAMEYCLSTGRVEKFIYRFGISDGAEGCTTCHYDKQMMAGDDDNQTIGSTTTQILSGNLMGGSNAWQQDDERYPMLKTFADTPYGKMLAMPVLFDGTDRAGNVNYIFEFPTENVSWRAINGLTYIDVINDCGAASIVERTDDDVEILIAQAENVESNCTRAMRTLPLNLRSGLTSFRFKDPVAQTAAEAAFDKESPIGTLTLRELVEATKSDFVVFNSEATGLKWFPEFRYFTSTTTLEEGMLSGLDQLCELQLPKKLTTIAANSFNGCSSLEEITLPPTFTTLKMGGLYGSSIKNLLINPKHPSMRSIDGALFQADNDGKLTLVAYPPGRGEESATISTLFHYIDDYAFYKIPNLKNIYIDNCLPEGNLVIPTQQDPIIHEDETAMMHIYVNDGSYGQYGSILFPEYENDFYWGEYQDNEHLHIYYPLNMTSAGWATLYIGFPTQLPEGFNAYVVTTSDADTHTATLKNIGRVIPKTTPVVIKNAAGLDPGIYPLTRWEGVVPTIPKYTNRFVGSYIGQEGKWGLDVNQETSITGGVLTLGRNSRGVVGFYKYNGAVIPPYRAYLTTNTVIEGAKGFTFVIDDTIDEIPNSIQNASSLREKQSAVFYDMTGRALQGKPTRPGVYIKNGKKIVIK